MNSVGQTDALAESQPSATRGPDLFPWQLLDILFSFKWDGVCFNKHVVLSGTLIAWSQGAQGASDSEQHWDLWHYRKKKENIKRHFAPLFFLL